MLSTIFWDPSRNFFVFPYVHHPVTWYGLLFALGFLVGYFLMRKILARHLSASDRSLTQVQLDAVLLTDRLAIFVVLGTVIGARLGHVFFYGWSYYSEHLIDIFKVWEGGLASHGGAIGILVGLILFVWVSKKKYPEIGFLTTLDALVLPAAFAGGCIRIGNFINQEITGIPTDLPWGVVFLHPIDGPAGVPLHPVQLYESLFYFLTFAILFLLWKKRAAKLGLGLYSGLFFVFVFTFRFFIEFLKQPQNHGMNLPFDMGQLLSLPFIAAGIGLLIYYFLRRKHAHT